MTATAEVKGELSHRTIKIINVTDPKQFPPHQIKETDEWSWRKLKYVKWHVYLDCNTGRLKKWKLS